MLVWVWLGSDCLLSCPWTWGEWRPCWRNRAGWWCTSACPCCWPLWWRQWCCWIGWSTSKRMVGQLMLSHDLNIMIAWCSHLSQTSAVSLQVWTVSLFLSSTQTSLQETLYWWLWSVVDNDNNRGIPTYPLFVFRNFKYWILRKVLSFSFIWTSWPWHIHVPLFIT